jgi:hypothetical protein
MPLWLLLAGGAGVLYYLWSSTHGAPGCPSPMGGPTGPRYTVNAPSRFYSTDPTTASASPTGSLAQGTYVFAAAQTPITSQDGTYELVLSPCNGPVWILVSNLTSS